MLSINLDGMVTEMVRKSSVQPPQREYIVLDHRSLNICGRAINMIIPLVRWKNGWENKNDDYYYYYSAEKWWYNTQRETFLG